VKNKEKEAVCRYKATATAGKNDCPPCSGDVRFRIHGFFTGEARKQLGPDMRLCEAHAAWLKKVNPCHRIIDD
jgi:hypothetical protein